MNLELRRKLTDEQVLGAEESLRLDQALEGQAVVANLVAQLEDQPCSLAWRSKLNQELIAHAGRSRRALTFRWLSGVTATMAAVAGIALVAFPRDPALTTIEPPRHIASGNDGSGVEELLFTAHREADIESGLGVSGDVSTESNSGS